MRVSKDKATELAKKGKLTKDGTAIKPIQLVEKKRASDTAPIKTEQDTRHLELIQQNNKEMLAMLVKILSRGAPEPVINVEPKLEVNPIINIPEPKLKNYYVTVSRDAFGDIESFEIETVEAKNGR